MKKILFIIYGLFIHISYAAPEVPQLGLPGDNLSVNTTVSKVGSEIIVLMIQYVAVIAVVSLMLAGIYYLISNGEEEKTKKAKNWIIWSLIGVLLSISAWGIINMINSVTINN